MNKSDITHLNFTLTDKTPEEIIRFFLEKFRKNITFATSFGAEDQVITHIIASIMPEASVFTLDTGRLFPETYDLIEKTESRYKIRIQIYFPDSSQVEEMVNELGVNLFYRSIENRKRCCGVRKIEPLQRALRGKSAWITGLRKEQSVTRENARLVEWDEHNKLVKVNPLFSWHEEEVWDYINKHNIPYNSLHDQGYRSIGCQPCTRPVTTENNIRSGRWWWENPDNKECGLHA